jgi:osmotically-inducible protein OsmY/predicted Ser/Thr protein kinase
MDPLIGQTIKGRFRVLRKLGEGAMGTVYLAEQLTIGRNVALKVLHREFARDEGFVARFRDEARAAASIHHAAVTVVHDYDQAEDGSLFIAMEFHEGRTLGEILRREGALDQARAVRIAIEIAEGLGAAHRAGVIHRDVKPHNIMIASDDQVKLMDFGIARLRDRGAAGLTQVGLVIGTPEYMAPEQIEGGEITEQADIYALGVVLYEMLTGSVPFKGTSAGAVLTRHLREAPPLLRQVRGTIPAALEGVVARALEKQVDRRQQHMGEVVKELRRIREELPPASGGPETILAAPRTLLVGSETRATSADEAIMASPRPRPPRPPAPAPANRPGRRRTLAVVGVVALLLIAVGAATVFYREPASDLDGVRAAAQARLRSEGLTGVTVEVTADGVATLSGVVQTREEADKAARAVMTAPGVKRVIPRIGLREPPQRLRELVEEQLRRQGWLKRSPADRVGLVAEVGDDAVVALVGTVPTAEAAAEAVRIAGAVPNVNRVIQRIDILDPRQIKAAVEEKLRAAGYPDVKAEIGGDLAVTLTGAVETRAREVEIVRLANEVQDVARVVSRLTVRAPAPEPPLPGRIQQAVEARLRAGGRLSELNVQVSGDQTVTLTGIVETPGEKDRALELARGVPGVRGVREKINVRCQWAGTC